MTTSWLENYFNQVTTGPAVWKWRHYFPIYERHFAKFRGQEVHVLEIGVYGGGSLRMWQAYFGETSHIYGVDIIPECKAHENEQTKIFIGDQADRQFWKDFKKQVPRLDIIIDDGGHMHRQQLITLEALLPHLNAGGVYLIEDIYRPRNPLHADLHEKARKLHDWIGTDQMEDDPIAPPDRQAALLATNDWQRTIDSVHTYPFVTVIEARDEPLTHLSNPIHGTEWL